jgi:hypothetical protein
VTLDGTKSYDPDGNTISFTWEQITGKPVTLLNPMSAMPSFTALCEFGVYEFRLTVSDGQVTQSDTVIISTNADFATTPVAIADGPRNSHVNESVELFGVASTSARGGALTYQWVLVDADDTATLIDADSATPEFSSSAVGNYRVRLTVTEEGVSSLESPLSELMVSVSAPGTNRAPKAEAGDDLEVFLATGTTVSEVLMGAGTDEDAGNQLSFKWNIISGPVDSQATLVNDTSEAVTFTTQNFGVYLLQLTVTDQDGLIDRDTATVVVRDPNGSDVSAPLNCNAIVQQEVVNACQQLERQTITSMLQFAPQENCSFGENGNLERRDRYKQAIELQTRTVPLPENALICGMDIRSPADDQFQYDDNLIITWTFDKGIKQRFPSEQN